MKEDTPVEWWKQGAVEGAPEPIVISPPKSNPFQDFEFAARPEHSMSFQDSIENVIRNFLNFSDRASRSEYWWFQLFFFVALAVADSIDVMISADGSGSAFGILVFLGLIIPNLAVTVRRLHDIGYSGWFLLLPLIPCLGSIFGLVIILLMIGDGQAQINNFGDVPTNTIVRE